MRNFSFTIEQTIKHTIIIEAETEDIAYNLGKQAYFEDYENVNWELYKKDINGADITIWKHSTNSTNRPDIKQNNIQGQVVSYEIMKY